MRAVTTERETRVCRAASAKLLDSATRTKVSIAAKRSMFAPSVGAALTASAAAYGAVPDAINSECGIARRFKAQVTAMRLHSESRRYSLAPRPTHKT